MGFRGLKLLFRVLLASHITKEILEYNVVAVLPLTGFGTLSGVEE